MSTNTLKHISDKSEFKSFDPTGSNFPPDITNVQEALATISLIGVTGNVPSATETSQGIIRLATTQEVMDGLDAYSAVTPATLKARLDIPTQATETYVGITRYATNAEAIAGTEPQAAIVATSLKAVMDYTFENRLSTENATGVIKISTTPAALAGTDDTTAMTPLKVSQAIGAATAALPVYSTATTTNEGLVRLATNAEVGNGNLSVGIAISPAGLATLTSTEERSGIIKLAGWDMVSNGTDHTAAVTPASLLARTGNTGRIGLVRLSTTVGQGDGNTALAYNANVISTSGGEIWGTLNVNGALRRNGVDVVTHDQLSDSVPVGTICRGWWGAIPDFRGLYPRGANMVGGYSEGEVNPHIAGNRGEDGKGKARLGNGVGSFPQSSVQAQALRYHKHAGGFGEHDNAGAFGNTATYTTLNSEGLIANETRPWTMSVLFIIKVE
ncbi:tail collar fiber protein [Escherichia phage vB_EcoM_005]|uniref:Short tail fibers protein n=1 Tax=Escherichia phage vB_EcoM_005 TaxID=2500761 RepID=A0A3T0ILN0_9CAUD|nr:tail collar fiber protein [Escherichia phage vB_EcoM_005]AZV00958.1 short tail fibers protein [Escherichia phage vB_EcoM_005]